MHQAPVGQRKEEAMESALNRRTLSETVACTLGAHDLKAQAERWRALWMLAGRKRVETEAGIRIVFANQPGAAEELRALAAVESECCSWAAWEVTSQDDALALDARSTGDGVATLHVMFADLVASTVAERRR
jgi:hypothetical protein